MQLYMLTTRNLTQLVNQTIWLWINIKCIAVATLTSLFFGQITICTHA